jgi:phospholipid-translocating ATPase
MLKSPPVSRPPNWDNLFILQVDASDFGVGAILSQLDMEGQEHPVAFASRKLHPREMNL